MAPMRRILHSMNHQHGKSLGLRILTALAACLVLAGCHQDMWNQAYYRAYEKDESTGAASSSRTPIEGVVAYQGARREWTAPVFVDMNDGVREVPSNTDVAFWTGRNGDGSYVADNYFEVTPELLARGQERFNISCSACHGLGGSGNGLVVQRGFPVPSTYHQDRLREVEDGYIFDVITNGFGRMYGYAGRIAPEDRWAIAAYVRVLQVSQNIDISDPESEMAKVVADGIHAQEAAAKKAADAAAHADHH